MKKIALIILFFFVALSALAIDLGNGVEYIPPSRKFAISTQSPSEQLTVNGSFALKESSAPSQSSNYGKIFINAGDSELYFRSDDQSSVKITNNGSLAVIGGATSIDGLSDARTFQQSMFLGANSGNNATGNWNTAVGTNALYSNTSGISNIALGSYALYSNTTGSFNIAIGNSLFSNTTGERNIALDNQALYSNTSGSDNIALGLSALEFNTTGWGNIALGTNALKYNQGSWFDNTNGSYNIVLGSGAMEFNTTGAGNVALGINALRGSKGDWNTGIGYLAGSNISQGSNNISIGANTLVQNANGNNQLNIGNLIYGNLSLKTLGVGIQSTKSGIELDVNGDLMIRRVLGFNGEVANISSSTTIPIDWTLGNRQKLTLNHTGVTINFIDPPLDSSLTLVITQGTGPGIKTVSTWNTNVRWTGGTKPPLSTTAGAIDMINCIYRTSPKMYLCTPSLNFL